VTSCSMWTELPPEKGHIHPTQFLAHVYCGQMAGWMKMPLGTEVELGPGHIVLDGIPLPAKEAQQPPPLFSAHIYCSHGRRSQLLLNSCLKELFESVDSHTVKSSVMEGTWYFDHVELMFLTMCS